VALELQRETNLTSQTNMINLMDHKIISGLSKDLNSTARHFSLWKTKRVYYFYHLWLTWHFTVAQIH